jgi:hydroxyacylglutathione hydrolase
MNFRTGIGWMIEPEKRIFLILESTRDVELAAQHLFRIGYDNVAGYLHQGMAAWENAALPLETIGIWTATDHSFIR